jgi:hypothetical protein
MNPAGRDASVAPDSIAALSRSVVTDWLWLFAGMTWGVAPVNPTKHLAINITVSFGTTPSRFVVIDADGVLCLANVLEHAVECRLNLFQIGAP